MEREDEPPPSNLLYRIEGYVERNRSGWVGKEINMGGRDEAETTTRAAEQELPR